MTQIANRALAAVKWGAIGTALRLTMQIGSQIVLARILGPDQYGLFAIGSVIVGFGAFFSDIGLAYGLIQKKEVTDKDIQFVLAWQLTIGTIVSSAIFAASPNIAQFFGDKRAEPIIAALGTICLLNAIAAPSLNILKRRLNFQRIQIAQVLSYFVGFLLCGIPLALLGYEAWSLVVAWIVQTTVFASILSSAVRHRLVPVIWYQDATAQFNYGFAVLLTNLVNWLIINTDRIVVGRMSGSTQIGLYATSYNLLYNPASAILGIIQPVFFSASAIASHDPNNDPAHKSNAYIALLSAIAIFIAPLFVFLAIVPETLVMTLYGAQWKEAATFFTPLSLAMPIFLVWGITTPILWAGGSVMKEFKIQLPIAFLWAVSCYYAATHSVSTVAWCVLLLYTLRTLCIMSAALNILQIAVPEVLRVVKNGVLMCCLVCLPVYITDSLLGHQPMHLKLCYDALAAVLAWTLTIRIFASHFIGPQLAAVLSKVITHLPAKLTNRLKFLVERKQA